MLGGSVKAEFSQLTKSDGKKAQKTKKFQQVTLGENVKLILSRFYMHL